MNHFLSDHQSKRSCRLDGRLGSTSSVDTIHTFDVPLVAVAEDDGNGGARLDPLCYPLVPGFAHHTPVHYHIAPAPAFMGRTYWQHQADSNAYAGLADSNIPRIACRRKIDRGDIAVARIIETIECCKAAGDKPKRKVKKTKPAFLTISGRMWDEIRPVHHYWPPGAPPPCLRPLFKNTALRMQIIYGDTDSVMMGMHCIKVEWTANAKDERVPTRATLEYAIGRGRADADAFNRVFAQLDMAPAIALAFEKLYLPFWIGSEKKMYMGVKYNEPASYDKLEAKTLGKKRDTYKLASMLLKTISYMIMLRREKSLVMEYVRVTLEQVIRDHAAPKDMSLFVKTKGLRKHAYASDAPDTGDATQSPTAVVGQSETAGAEVKTITQKTAIPRGPPVTLLQLTARTQRGYEQSRRTRISNSGRRVPVVPPNRFFSELPEKRGAKATSSVSIGDHASANARFEREFPGESYSTGSRVPYFVRFELSGYTRLQAGHHPYASLLTLQVDAITKLPPPTVTSLSVRLRSSPSAKAPAIPESSCKTSELSMVLDHWERIVGRARTTGGTTRIPSPDMRYYVQSCASLLTKLMVDVPGYTPEFFPRLAAFALQVQCAYHTPPSAIRNWLSHRNITRDSLDSSPNATSTSSQLRGPSSPS